jgi:3-dehydroquinate synthase
MNVKTLRVRLKPVPYEVLVGYGLLDRAGELCLKALPENPSRWLVVTSPRVRSLWGGVLERSLRATEHPVHVIDVDDGEQAKTFSNVERIVAEFAQAGSDRASVVVALGGGVVGDMAGFAASIYLRGLRVVQVPTTVLAQVDSAVGGKTGVNLAAGKNLVGTFHQPSLVIADPQVLSSLPEREFRAGLFEVIKSGAIRSQSLFEYALGKRSKILKQEKSALERIIAESVEIKAGVVAADEREGDLRRILNFGHTIGHALEAATGYRHFLHGEAVGWGMVAAAYIGVQHGVTPKKVAEKVAQAVHAYGPLPEANLPDEALLPFIAADKKTRHGIPHFVLLQDLGKTVIAGDVSDVSIAHGLQAMRNASALRGQSHG